MSVFIKFSLITLLAVVIFCLTQATKLVEKENEDVETQEQE